MRLAHRGLALDVPRGWDARIYRRREVASGEESTHAVLHAGNFALPDDRGDYGSGAVELMGPAHALVVLLEHHPSAVGTALFANAGIPRRLAAEHFGPRQLQRTIPGQAGTQVFFSDEGRAFCLYVVLGSHRNRARLVPSVNDLLATLEVSPVAAR